MSIVGKGFKLMGCLIKLLFGLLIFAVCGFLLWRIFSSSTPDSLTDISVNDAIYEAYEADGELGAFRQEQGTITRGARSPGYFSITHTVFIPEANQIQVVLRYNNSTIRNLTRDYSLESEPDRSEELFDVNLFFSVDLTPENTEDNAILTEEGTRTFRCSSKLVSSEEKSLYNYRKFVFDLDECGEDLEELLNSRTLLAVYADIYYVEDMDLDTEAYGTLCLYDYKTKTEDVELSRRERESIEAWKND
jgi:hypothetical protein